MEPTIARAAMTLVAKSVSAPFIAGALPEIVVSRYPSLKPYRLPGRLVGMFDFRYPPIPDIRGLVASNDRLRPVADTRTTCMLPLAGGMSMFVMESVEDLWNHIAYVILYAPNFPYRDFLAPNEQMTLDRAFEQLHAGVVIAYPEEQFRDKRHELHGILDQSFLAYQNGQDIEGGKLMNEFEERIFKR